MVFGSSALSAVERESSSTFETVDRFSPSIPGRSPNRVLSAGPAEPRFFNEVVTPPPHPFSTWLGTGLGGFLVFTIYYNSIGLHLDLDFFFSPHFFSSF